MRTFAALSSDRPRLSGCLHISLINMLGNSMKISIFEYNMIELDRQTRAVVDARNNLIHQQSRHMAGNVEPRSAPRTPFVERYDCCSKKTHSKISQKLRE